MDCALGVVRERVERILSGETTTMPNKDRMESPCAWCDHSDACLYDSMLPGCRIKELDHKRRMNVIHILLNLKKNLVYYANFGHNEYEFV